MVWKEVAHERTPMSTKSRRVSLYISTFILHVFLVLWADADRPRSMARGGGWWCKSVSDSGIALVGLASESRAGNPQLSK